MAYNNLNLLLQYGHFFPDPQYENVQHIICCDSFATYAYDFEFANNVGFSRSVFSNFPFTTFQVFLVQFAYHTKYVLLVAQKHAS